jgi:hypothetical protein
MNEQLFFLKTLFDDIWLSTQKLKSNWENRFYKEKSHFKEADRRFLRCRVKIYFE